MFWQMKSPKYNLKRERAKMSRKSPGQKKPWSSSQRPPRSFPSGIDLSNLTPILEDPFSSKASSTLPR